MQDHNISPVMRFIAAKVSEKEYKGDKIQASTLFQQYNDFIAENKFKSQLSSVSFFNELKELQEEEAGVYKVKQSTMFYKFVKSEFEKYCKIKKIKVFDEEEAPKTVINTLQYMEEPVHDDDDDSSVVSDAESFESVGVSRSNACVEDTTEPELETKKKKSKKNLKADSDCEIEEFDLD
jgi:hypothetical protein